MRGGPKLLWAVGWEGPDLTVDGLRRCGMDTEGRGDIILMIFLFFLCNVHYDKTLDKRQKVGFCECFGFFRRGY